MLNFYNVWVAEETEQLDFSQDASSVRDMIKDICDLLDGYFFPSVLI